MTGHHQQGRSRSTPVIARLHIGRLVLDAGSVGNLGGQQVAAQVQTALAALLAGQVTTRPQPLGLAHHIANAVVPELQARLAGSGDRNPSGPP
jgi:hypothetical protein